jgi:hypothetical protein
MSEVLAVGAVALLVGWLSDWASKLEKERKRKDYQEAITSLKEDLTQSRIDFFKRVANKISSSMMIIYLLLLGVFLIIVDLHGLIYLFIPLGLIIILLLVLYYDFTWEKKRQRYIPVFGEYSKEKLNITKAELFNVKNREMLKQNIQKTVQEADSLLEGNQQLSNSIYPNQLFEINIPLSTYIIKINEIYYFNQSINLYVNSRIYRDRWYKFWKPKLIQTIISNFYVSDELNKNRTDFEQKLVDRIIITIFLGFLFFLFTNIGSVFGENIDVSVYSVLGILFIFTVLIYIVAYQSMNYPLLRDEIINSFKIFVKDQNSILL